MDIELARIDYVTGDMSMEEIAEKYSVSPAWIGQHASKQGWVKERDKYRRKRARKLIKAVESDQIKKIREHLKVIDASIQAFTAQLVGKVKFTCEHCGNEIMVNIPKTKISAAEVNSLIKTRTQLAEALLQIEDREKRLILPSDRTLEEMTYEEIKKFAEDKDIEITEE